MSALPARRPDVEPPARPPMAEARDLAALVGQCTTAGAHRSALALRLSHVTGGGARPHQVRLARSALDPLRVADRARLFELPNRDMVVVWRGEAAQALEASRRAVAHLFEDDPSATPDTLVELFELPADTRPLLALVAQSLPATPPPEPRAPALPPLDGAALAALEAQLARTDLSRFVRRRPICAMAQMNPVLVWEERRVRVAELADALLPGRSARADAWLFRRLTRTLDRRMLSLLADAPTLRAARPFGLNLNVASLLSPEFLRFDACLPTALRGEIVVAVRPADLLADPGAWLFARDFARRRGYRFLLCGLDLATLPIFPPDDVGVDWLELPWSPRITDLAALPAPAARIVLARVAAPEVLAWGAARGIALYSGPALGSGRC